MDSGPAFVLNEKAPWRQSVYEPVGQRPDQTEHQVSRNAGTENVGRYRRRAEDETQQLRDYKNKQEESANEEDSRWDQVGPKMAHPSRGERWNRQQDCYN